MKKVLAISLALNGALVVMAGLCWKELTAHAAGGGGAPKGNGDVNGDGFINITDVIGILNWMFLGGDAPVAIDCQDPAGKGLPATGQTQCYDLYGMPTDCASADFPGRDGFYQAGCPTAGRFTDNGDGTVTDNCTGLMWQKSQADVNGNGKIDIDDHLNWQAALKYCENLNFAGHDDWRLPNVRELLSIVDYGRKNPAIDQVFELLPLAEPYWSYWSSSFHAFDPGVAWVVDFHDSLATGGDEFGGLYVRAVRTVP